MGFGEQQRSRQVVHRKKKIFSFFGCKSSSKTCNKSLLEKKLQKIPKKYVSLY